MIWNLKPHVAWTFWCRGSKLSEYSKTGLRKIKITVPTLPSGSAAGGSCHYAVHISSRFPSDMVRLRIIAVWGPLDWGDYCLYKDFTMTSFSLRLAWKWFTLPRGSRTRCLMSCNFQVQAFFLQRGSSLRGEEQCPFQRSRQWSYIEETACSAQASRLWGILGAITELASFYLPCVWPTTPLTFPWAALYIEWNISCLCQSYMGV